MTVAEMIHLLDAVRKMRAAQKLHDANRSTADLARAKELEAEVDALLADPPPPGARQGRLFDAGGPYGEGR